MQAVAVRWLLALGIVLPLLAGLTRPRPAQADEPAWQGHALGQAGIGTLLAPPGQPGLLYAAGLGLQGTVATDFFRGDDGGATWAARNIVSGTTDAGVGLYGVRKSGDGGDAWTAQNAGLPGPALSSGAIAVDPVTPSTLYLSDGAFGLFKSTDAAATWHAFAAVG